MAGDWLLTTSSVQNPKLINEQRRLWGSGVQGAHPQRCLLEEDPSDVEWGG